MVESCVCALAERWTSSPQTAARQSARPSATPLCFAIDITTAPWRPFATLLCLCLFLPTAAASLLLALALLLLPFLNFPFSQRYPIQTQYPSLQQQNCNAPRHTNTYHKSPPNTQVTPACLCSRSSRRRQLASTSSPLACKFTPEDCLLITPGTSACSSQVPPSQVHQQRVGRGRRQAEVRGHQPINRGGHLLRPRGYRERC